MKTSQRFIESYKKGFSLPERRFLLDVIRRLAVGDRGAVPLPAGLDWGRIDQFVRQENLGPVCHFVLANHPVDPKLLAAWRDERMVHLNRNIRIAGTADGLFRRFERNGLEAVALRGLHLAHFVYPDAGLRPMHDVDILVRADRNAVRAVMESRGVRPLEILRTQDVFLLDQVTFEIHYSFLTTRRYRAELDTGRFLESARKRRTAEGHEIVCPSPEAELISVVTHGYVHHGFDRMRMLIDIALLMAIPGMDWDAVIGWTRKAGLDRMFHFALALANHLFELGRGEVPGSFGPPPPSWWPDAFEAYACRIWGWDNEYAFRLRCRTQFHVARTPMAKIRQLVRFFGPDSVRSYAGLLSVGQATRKIGRIESVHDVEPS